jgi:hypothetical protein
MTIEVRDMKQDTHDPQQRRHFLKASAVLSAGAAAAALIPGLAPAADTQVPQGEPTAKPGQKGYQASQHVLDYYRTARI